MATLVSLLILFGPILAIVVLASALELIRPDAPREKDSLRWLHSAVLYLSCTLLVFLVVPGGHLAVIRFTYLESWGLLHRPGVPYALSVALGILALDFSEWLSHVILHRVSFLWRLHRIHHSDEHLDIAETGIHEIRRQRRKAAFPGPTLSGARTATGPDGHLFGQHVTQASLQRREADGGRSDERQLRAPQAARSRPCGWGLVLTRKPVGPLLRK